MNQQPGQVQMGQPGMMQPGMMQPGMMQPGMMQPVVMAPGMMPPMQHKCAYCNMMAVGKCDKKVQCYLPNPCGNYYCIDHQATVRVGKRSSTTCCTECEPILKKNKCKFIKWFCCIWITCFLGPVILYGALAIFAQAAEASGAFDKD